MTSPGGRIEIRVDPDLRGFASKTASGLSDAAKTGVAAFASAAKVALVGAAVGISAAAIVATKSTLDIGIAYQDQLNTLKAVSGATEDQMVSVGATAKELGSDLTLPATSAKDAAAVMTELAKASFTVADAQAAAKGSLQLAAAAQIDGARAAEIQANAINAFSLKASDATRVADVLANAANASSAEITDIADALQQASAVAASAKISIEDTATVLGILANNGIKGADAGTLVKSAILALQSPSKSASAAMRELNLEAYDSQGNFVGLRSIFEQLAAAQGVMTQQAYESATSTLFGSDAARLAGIAAKEGGEGFDFMAGAIGRQGAAADVAAAKSQGLGGAIEAFKSQLETVQIDVFERAAPSLEKYVRLAAERLPEVADRALAVADQTVAYFSDMAPRIGQVLEARRDTIAKAWEQLAQPILAGAAEIGPEVLDLVVDVAQKLADLAGDAIDEVEPLAQAVGHLVASLDDAGGPLQVTGAGLGLAADAAGAVLDAAEPLISIVSGLVDGFADLPGPLQTVVLGLGALKVASSIDLFGKLTDRGGAAAALSSAAQNVVGFTQTVKTNMKLAGDEVGAFEKLSGGLSTALQTYLPDASGAVSSAFSQIGGAFKQGREEAAGLTDSLGLDADKFQQFARGISTAAREASSQGMSALRAGFAGVRSAGSSAVSMLGGPWGIALAGAGLAIGKFTADVEASKQGNQAAEDAGIGLAKAYAQLGTIYGTQAAGARDAALAQSGLDKAMDDAKVSVTDQVEALRGNRDAQLEVIEAMKARDKEEVSLGGSTAGAIWDRLTGKYNDNEENARKLFNQLGANITQTKLFSQITDDSGGALQSFQDDVTKVFGAAALANQPIGDMRQAMADLATASGDAARETDAVRRILDGIGAGAASADEVLANTTTTVAGMREAFTGVAEGAVNAAGAIDLNSQAGAQLYQRLQEQGSGYKDLIAQTYSSVEATNGAAAAAEAAGQKATELRTGFLLAAEGAGISSAEANRLADQLGLVPADVTTTFLQPGMNPAQAGADLLRDKVLSVPDSKTVITSALTSSAVQALESLGFKVENLQDGTVKVTADTSSAAASINSLITRYQNYPINVGVGGIGARYAAANGGYISGPGTSTSDSIPALLSNGEYVQRAAATAAVGRSTMDAINRMDWKAALPRLLQLAGAQSQSSVMAAVAGRSAAAAAGRFAAGGYVDALARQQSTGSATAVPVAVGDVVGAQYNGPVYLVDPEEQARQSRRNVRAAMVASGLGRR